MQISYALQLNVPAMNYQQANSHACGLQGEVPTMKSMTAAHARPACYKVAMYIWFGLSFATPATRPSSHQHEQSSGRDIIPAESCPGIAAK